ncbi:MAG: hypothetical protein EXQ47_08230 [Bryobacterales bacterium]|nr:hypothetical protein [Bryobacterales bacterium]
MSRALGVGTFWGIAAVTVWLFYFDGFTLLLSNASASLPVEVARAQSRVHPDSTIAVLGNSTAAEDFRAEWFNTHTQGARALNLGIPSGHVYLFERMLALAMREGVQPRKIILTTTPEVLSLRRDFDFLLNDLTLLKTVIGGEDLARLAEHAQGVGSYIEYASRVAIRPALYHSELRDFLLHPVRRFNDAAAVRNYLASIRRDTPPNESGNSFSVCGIGPLAKLDDRIARLQAVHDPATSDYAKVRAGFAVRAHQPLAVDAFAAGRFRHMLRTLAAAAPVYVIAAPFYDPDYEQYPLTYRARAAETIRKVAAGVADVTMLPDFQADCSMFADTVHLNRNGGEQFTEYLRARVL